MIYLQQAMGLKEELVANRRYLHQHPEVGFRLEKTIGFVWSRLEEMGIQPQQCGRAGITGLIGGRQPGPVMLLRADMDALPLREESGLPFASNGEYAHCCGHDMHTAMLLGAARMLKESEGSLHGTVKLMFQPAEETLEGAKDMIAAGILQNPQVDAAMACHMLAMAPTGMVGYGTGIVSASSNSFAIHIQGKGGHGAMPEKTVDPINVGAHLHLSLQELISRETDCHQAAVLTFGSFHAGNAHNIIPDTAELKGTLRTYDKDVRGYLLQRLDEVAGLTAKSFRAQAKVEHAAATPSLVVNEAVAETVSRALTELLGPQGVMRLEERMSGSEDFAEIGDRVPAMLFVLGGGLPEEGHCHALHHPKVTFNEDALPIGAAAFAHGAAEWLRVTAGR